MKKFVVLCAVCVTIIVTVAVVVLLFSSFAPEEKALDIFAALASGVIYFVGGFTKR